MPPKSEADHIYLLLAIIEHTDTKPNWDEVAKVTGLYKSGKFVRQAFASIKTKYDDPQTGTSVKTGGDLNGKKAATGTTTKKRSKGDDKHPSKRTKTTSGHGSINEGISEDVEVEEEEV